MITFGQIEAFHTKERERKKREPESVELRKGGKPKLFSLSFFVGECKPIKVNKKYIPMYGISGFFQRPNKFYKIPLTNCYHQYKKLFFRMFTYS